MNKNKQTKEAICNFVINICMKERFIELKRQLLCDNSDFEPYLAYSRLTRDSKEGITAGCIYSYLNENSIQTNLKRCQVLVNHYSAVSDGNILGYKSFLEIVLPKENPELRAFVTQRETYDISQDEYLCYDTELSLAELLDYEIKLFEDLHDEKKRLDDLNLDAQQIIDNIDYGCNTKNINFNNLRKYLNECGVLPYDSEIISLLRRIDRDDDGVLILTEFKKFLERFDQKIPDSESHQESTTSRRLSRKMKPLRSPSSRKVVNTKVRLIQSGKRSDSIVNIKTGIQETSSEQQDIDKENQTNLTNNQIRPDLLGGYLNHKDTIKSKQNYNQANINVNVSDKLRRNNNVDQGMDSSRQSIQPINSSRRDSLKYRNNQEAQKLSLQIGNSSNFNRKLDDETKSDAY